ncbi:MAG TPA: propionyl-CoA synthetase [Actinomycetes bacterium]|nr:propionyl-CoA synthetase [Actinomycetes bacterium]
MSDYWTAYAESLADPDGFWGKQSALVDWVRRPERILDDRSAPLFRWFTGGRLNTCANALDRHVAAGRGDQTAIIYDSPVTGSRARLSYAELLDQVERFAGVLRSLGVGHGDRVVVYMPMIPEAAVAMLACARLGAVHCVVFGGFAAHELAIRIDDARPSVLVAASCGVEPAHVVRYLPIVDAALEQAQFPPQHVVVLERQQEPVIPLRANVVDWRDAMAAAEPVEAVPVAATDPLYVLYTSGTTGRPRGVVRDNGGHAVALRWSMTNVFGIRPGETWWAASDIGWVVGHSYIVYGPLLTGATTVVYEGKPVGTPDAGAFWRVASEHALAGMFTAPTALRAIRRDDPEGKRIADYDLSALRAIFLAGERLDPETYEWTARHLGIPVVDNWWQTETGWPICANPQGMPGTSIPIKAGSPTRPMPGYDVQVLDSDGGQVPAGEEGSICIRLPLPPGTLPSLWNDDARYIRDYLTTFPGYYATGDGGHFDDEGHLFVMGRTDDIINCAGHRLSTGALEAVLATHSAVAECAVIGVHDDIKGQVPRGLVVLKAGATVDETQLARDLVALVRDQVGPVASLKRVDVVPALPKTRSGKILRRTMRGIADGRDEPIPSTIEDPAVLDRIRTTLLAP